MNRNKWTSWVDKSLDKKMTKKLYTYQRRIILFIPF